MKAAPGWTIRCTSGIDSSACVDGTPYKLDRSSDGYPQLYKSIGRTAKIAELADSDDHFEQQSGDEPAA